MNEWVIMCKKQFIDNGDYQHYPINLIEYGILRNKQRAKLHLSSELSIFLEKDKNVEYFDDLFLNDFIAQFKKYSGYVGPGYYKICEKDILNSFFKCELIISLEKLNKGIERFIYDFKEYYIKEKINDKNKI